MSKIEKEFQNGEVLYAEDINQVVDAVNDNADKIAGNKADIQSNERAIQANAEAIEQQGQTIAQHEQTLAQHGQAIVAIQEKNNQQDHTIQQQGEAMALLQQTTGQQGEALNGIAQRIGEITAAGYSLVGVISTNINPPAPATGLKVYYIATPGAYTHFGASSMVVPDGTVGFILYDNGWSLEVVQTGHAAFINVNKYNGQSAAYASAAAARAAVPAGLRKPGLQITYLLSTGENTSQWVQDMFIGDDVTDWGVANNWKVVGPVSVSQNIETALQEGELLTIGNDITEIGDVAKINRLDADVDSILKLEVGTIDTATGINVNSSFYRNRARIKNYISSPFEITLNNGFEINNLLRYSKNTDGTITFVKTLPAANMRSADDYLYRLTIKKSNNEDILPSELETAVSTFKGKLGYTIADNEKKKAPLYNINKLLDTPTTYYTLSEAITALPSVLRAMGCIITFRMSYKIWGFYQYSRTSVSDTDFLNVNNWNFIGPSLLTFSFHSGLDNTTGKSKFLITDYYSTPFLRCQQGLHITAHQSPNNAACCFYDEQFNFISALVLPTGIVQFVLGATGYEIPSGATYFRASGTIDDYIVEMVQPAADAYMVENWQNSPIQNFEQFFIKGKAYSVGSLNIGDTVTISDNGSIKCLRIWVKQGDVFYVDGTGAGGPRLWAWCDSAMKLISKADASITFAGNITAPADGYLLINSWFSINPIAHIHRINYTVKQDVLINKANWLALGDSITQGWYSYKDTEYPHGHGVNNPVKGWVYKMGKITGNIVTNRGIGGTGFVCVGTGQSDINARQLVDTFTAEYLANIQLVTLAYGINDYKKGNITLGTMEDDVTTGGTVVSNMRYVIEKLQALNPTMKIIVITPLNAAGYYGQELGDETTNYAIGHTKNGKTLQDYFNAFVEVCQYYGIQYIDATHHSVISRKAIPEQLPDGVHPSDYMHTMLAREFSQKITCY